MKSSDVRQLLTTPINAPAYPPGPYRFTNREYLNITYRTDPAALAHVVPEPLQVRDPLVRFELMRMPDVTGLGDYTEAGQMIAVEFDGETAEFSLGMYVDSHPAIAGGRELSSYPKKLGKPRLYVDSDTLVGTVHYGSLPVATATMGYKHHTAEAEDARAEISAPTYMLKVMRNYDGQPRICELTRTTIADLTVKGAWTGPARLHLFEHALAPFADLPVLEIVAGSHILADLTLAPATIVHDYLQ